MNDNRRTIGPVELLGGMQGLRSLRAKPARPRFCTWPRHLNRYGYHPAVYAARGCTGCGLCFFACPEPRSHSVV